MNRLLVVACAAGLVLFPAASAQTPAESIPDELRAAGQAALDYVKSVPAPRATMFYDAKTLLNSSSEQLRKRIDEDRAQIAKAREALEALELPTLKTKDFDVSFALKRMRDNAGADIAIASKQVDALDAMIVAQKKGDCSAYATQAQVFEETNRKLTFSSTVNDRSVLQQFLARYAGVEKSPELMLASVAPVSDAALLKHAANTLAVSLRCPRPDVSFDIDVSISLLAGAQPPKRYSTAVRVTSSMNASQRGSIESRFDNFGDAVAGNAGRLAQLKQPLKFHWDGHVLAPVIE